LKLDQQEIKWYNHQDGFVPCNKGQEMHHLGKLIQEVSWYKRREQVTNAREEEQSCWSWGEVRGWLSVGEVVKGGCQSWPEGHN